MDYDSSHIQKQVIFYHERDGEELVAPVNAGQVLGEVTVVEVDDNNQVVRTFGSSLLVATSTVDMSRWEYLRSQTGDLFHAPVVRRLFTVLIILFAVYILLVFFYSMQRMRHMKSLRAARRERANRQIAEEAEWLEFPQEPEAPMSEKDNAPNVLPDNMNREDFFDSFFDE